MRKLLYLVIGIIGCWIMLAAAIFHWDLPSVLYSEIFLGLIVLVIAVTGFKQHENNTIGVVSVICGIVLLLYGIFFQFGLRVFINEIIMGIMIISLGWLIIQIPTGRLIVDSYDKDKLPMAAISNIEFDPEKKYIRMKANLMQTMPMKIDITPVNAFKALGLLEFDVIKSLPAVLIQGWNDYKKEEKQDDDATPGWS